MSGQAFTITGACAAGTASAQLALTGEEHVLSPSLYNTTPNPDGTFELAFAAGNRAPTTTTAPGSPTTTAVQAAVAAQPVRSNVTFTG